MLYLGQLTNIALFLLTLHPNFTNMKKLIILISTILLPVLAAGQAQINTKKIKISDFTDKVTKVVLNGNSFYDVALKDEIAARWRISPYEFCTLDEFEELKNNDQYYFLMSTYGQFRKETAPGLQFLTLVKGGAGADKGIGDMLEVVSIPFASAEYPSGRELIFLPAFIDIIQEHTLNSMEKDITAYGGLVNYNGNMTKSSDMAIVFSEDDLKENISEELINLCKDKGITVTDEDSADEYFINNEPNTLVSYTAAPSEPVPGSYCYKMLIDAGSHKLYFYKKHRITKKAGSGFMPDDIERIIAHRKNR